MDISSLGDEDLELGPLNTTVQYRGLVEGSKNSHYYVNKYVDAVLSVNRGHVYGHMQLDDGDSYVVEYCGNGIHVLKQLDGEKLEDRHREEDEDLSSYRDFQPENIEDTTTLVTYSIKVYYTPSFAAVTADIEGFLEQVIQETNQGYINSNVPLRASALCIEEATIDDMPNAGEMLNAFTNMKGTLENLRDSADVAVLLVEDLSDYAGIGYTNTISTGKTVSVVTKGSALGYYTFAHEIGHNIGLYHNREVVTNPWYPDGYGYLIPKGTASTGLRTILAYGASGHMTRVNYYSNPDIIHPNTGTATGVVDKANNARILTLNRFSLAALGDESQCGSDNIEKECFIENVSFSEYYLTEANELGYSKQLCQEACLDKSTCYEWLYIVYNEIPVCNLHYMDIRNPGEELPDWTYMKDVTTLNVNNPKCTIIKNCSTPGRSVPYTLSSQITPDAKVCHHQCLANSKCNHWVWEQKNHECYLKGEYISGTDEGWTINFRTCGV